MYGSPQGTRPWNNCCILCTRVGPSCTDYRTFGGVMGPWRIRLNVEGLSCSSYARKVIRREKPPCYYWLPVVWRPPFLPFQPYDRCGRTVWDPWTNRLLLSNREERWDNNRTSHSDRQTTMPRIPPSLFWRVRRLSPAAVLLLPACRDLPSSLAELRWIQQHVADEQTEGGRQQTRTQREAVLRLCRRRGRGEPLQYVLGTQPFGSLDLLCRRGVLIPRFGL